MISTIFLLLSVIFACINAQFFPPQVPSVCNVSDFNRQDGDPDLPELPDQFYYALEASLVERNATIYAAEYFDGIGNRGRLDLTDSGTKTVAISDYNLRESFVFPNTRTGEECSVSQLTTNTTSRSARMVFGIVPGDNGTVHIGAPSFIFYNSINRSKINYLGLQESRGIPAYRWQACVDNAFISFTIDYYFTTGSLWTNPYNEQGYIPVTVELTTNRINTSTNSVVNVKHYYSFVDYRTGNDSVSDDVFMVPTGLICSGRQPGNPIPSLPDYFSTGLEIVRSDGVQNYQEYYDFTNQLLRADGYTQSLGSFTVVEDFNSETNYLFNSSTCTTSQLSYDRTRFQADRDDDGHLHLKRSRDFFFAQDFRDFVYEGVTNVRGVNADVWIVQNVTDITVDNSTYSNWRYQLFFTRPGQTVNSIYGTTSDPVLVQTTFSAVLTTVENSSYSSVRNISSTVSYYSFSSLEPPLDVYDVSPCLSSSEYADLRMRINSTVTSRNNLKQSIRTSITDYAKSIGMPLLYALQISAVNVGNPSDDSSYTYAHVHIANVSMVATRQWDYTANSLVNRITQNLKDGDPLPFTISVDGMEITAYYNQRGGNEDSNQMSQDEGLSDTTIAVISIGTFMGGVLVGVVSAVLLFVVCTMCRTKKENVNFFDSRQSEAAARYERQVDEQIDLPDVAVEND